MIDMSLLKRIHMQMIVCLFSTFIFSTSLASLQCLDLFEIQGQIVRDDDHAIELLGQAEVRLQQIAIGRNLTDLEAVLRIQRDIEAAVQILGSGKSLQFEINSLFARIEKIEKEIDAPKWHAPKVETLDDVHQVWTFDKMIDPSQIKPDQVYLFEWRAQNKNIKVIFSKRAVEDIFEKAEYQPQVMDAAKKLLRTITKGYVGSAESNGIKRFNADKSVFEVSFIGNTGTWRMGAYVYEGVLYITHGVSSGNHGGSNYGTSFINTVNSIRRQSGH